MPPPYRQKADELKALVNRKFFNPETGVYAEGTQTAQAIALYLGIVPEGKEQLVADKLCEVVRANNHFLDFGLLGSKSVPAMLTRYGYVEDAMKMITKKSSLDRSLFGKKNSKDQYDDFDMEEEKFQPASGNKVTTDASAGIKKKQQR